LVRAEGLPADSVISALADPTGAFRVVVPEAPAYLVSVEREGYFELTNRKIRADERDVTLVLSPVREVFQTLDVTDTPSPVNPDQTSREEHLTGTEINNVPYPNSHSLRNSLHIMPQTIQDQTGGLHFAGGAENQTLYTLNGFDVSDPVTGRLTTRVPVDGVQSVELTTGRYSPEYGKGSSGVLAIRTDSGSDALRYTATNFFPSVNTQSGWHLGDWTPRFGVSGPIVKGRAWFADGLDFQYANAYVNGLPSGQNNRNGLAGSNTLHTQVNLTPSNILFGDLLVNFDNESNVGLGVLDTVPTTVDTHTREYFWSLKDQIYLHSGILLELGLAQNRFSTRTIPQGTAPYVITPEGRSGNYFVNSTQDSQRTQVLGNAYLPSFRLAGSHQIKVGVDLDRLDYDGDFQRTSYERIGLAGTVLSRTFFVGSGQFTRPDAQISSYVMDDWRLRENLQLQFGVRQDWDELVKSVVFSPRISVSWSPFASRDTRVSGGFAITYDSVPLALFARPLDQRPVTYNYAGDGSQLGLPVMTIFEVPYGNLKQPRYNNWTATVDRRFKHGFNARLDYLYRDGVNGFTYTGLPFAPFSPVISEYLLTNSRTDRYRSVQVSVRKTFSGQYEWFTCYIHSSATSNAVLDVSADQVFRVLDNYGPLPWDTPNRILSWAYLPLPFKSWAVSFLLDGRSGFPYSIQDERGNIVGDVNSQRYPFNFELNLYLEKTFAFRGYRFAIRGGVNNLTNTLNPTAVNSVVGSPDYLHYYGSEGRHIQFRLRFFGRG